jgi:hypothetical protein
VDPYGANPYNTRTPPQPQSQSAYRDMDGDGIPDAVMGPNGLWQSFNPYTGEMLGASPWGAETSEGNPLSPLTPASFGIGTPGGSTPVPPKTPAPKASQFSPASFGAGTASVPTYRDGSTHPAFGGAPRVPGGQWASQSSGGSNQEQVHVPGGASAGPFNTSAAPAPRQQAQGGGTFFNKDGLSGKGGGTSPLYDKFRAKGDAMAGKVRSMGTGGTSSSSYNYPSSNYKPYEPETPKMKGFARKFEPEQALGLYSRPSMMMPRIAPGFMPENPRYGDIESLPMTELTMLTGGKKLSAPKVDEYGNLTAKDRSLSDFTNALADTYDRTINGEEWFDYDQMAHNLMNMRNKSALGAGFKKMPAGSQASTLLNLTGAMFGTTLDPSSAATRQDRASALANQLASKYLTRKSKNTPNLAKAVSRDLFYQ